MRALFVLVLVALGCGSAERVTMAPRTAFSKVADTPSRVEARIGPMAGLGSGVRRVDAELR